MNNETPITLANGTQTQLSYGEDNHSLAQYAEELRRQLEPTSSLANSSARLKNYENFVADVFEGCCDFLQDQRLVNSSSLGKLRRLDAVIGCEALDSKAGLSGALSANALETLLDRARIPEAQRDTARQSVCVLLAKFLASNDNAELIHAQMGRGDRSDSSFVNNLDNTMAGTYASFADIAVNNAVPFAGLEAFGVAMDKTLPDIRSALTVLLLRFHKGLCDRFLHRQVSNSPYVRYVAIYAEYYDMLLSNDKDHAVRNDGDHRQPFINLYADAAPVTNELQLIVPLKENDTSNKYLVADGVLKCNVEANILDLGRVDEFGKSHINMTDLISENVAVDSIIVKFTKNSTTEKYQLQVSDLPSARLTMYPNADDSSDRLATVRHICSLNKDSKTIEGETTTLFKEFKDNDFLRVALSFTANIRLKTGDVSGYGACTFGTFNRANAPVASGATSSIEGMTIEIEGYVLDARYSEENLRRANLAIQTAQKTFDYEISNGRYILVDFSLQQKAPEHIMKFVTEASSLGQDHKMLDIVTHTLLHVYDRNHEEQTVPGLHHRLNKLGFNYVAGMRVRPTVYLATIDLTQVDTIRSSDLLGDIRQLVEWQLMNLISLLHQNSYYKHQIDDGEIPKYKVCTSNVIIDNLLSIPHIHNHLDKDTPVNGNSDVEYRRVLPNGTELDCISTTFNQVRDLMIIIPYRDGAPESELNFGHNWDFGQFVGLYTPQYDNAANKRIIANSRVQVIPTNPIGLYVNIEGLDTIINMFAKGAPTKSKLPNPSDLIVPQI